MFKLVNKLFHRNPRIKELRKLKASIADELGKSSCLDVIHEIDTTVDEINCLVENVNQLNDKITGTSLENELFNYRSTSDDIKEVVVMMKNLLLEIKKILNRYLLRQDDVPDELIDIIADCKARRQIIAQEIDLIDSCILSAEAMELLGKLDPDCKYIYVKDVKKAKVDHCTRN